MGKIDAIASSNTGTRSHVGEERRDRIHRHSNAIALCILDLGQENYHSEFMSTYNEVLSQVESLTSDEQLRLLEELAALVRRRITFESQSSLQETQEIGRHSPLSTEAPGVA